MLALGIQPLCCREINLPPESIAGRGIRQPALWQRHLGRGSFRPSQTAQLTSSGAKMNCPHRALTKWYLCEQNKWLLFHATKFWGGLLYRKRWLDYLPWIWAVCLFCFGQWNVEEVIVCQFRTLRTSVPSLHPAFGASWKMRAVCPDAQCSSRQWPYI